PALKFGADSYLRIAGVTPGNLETSALLAQELVRHLVEPLYFFSPTLFDGARRSVARGTESRQRLVPFRIVISNVGDDPALKTYRMQGFAIKRLRVVACLRDAVVPSRSILRAFGALHAAGVRSFQPCHRCASVQSGLRVIDETDNSSLVAASGGNVTRGKTRCNRRNAQ